MSETQFKFTITYLYNISYTNEFGHYVIFLVIIEYKTVIIMMTGKNPQVIKKQSAFFVKILNYYSFNVPSVFIRCMTDRKCC